MFPIIAFIFSATILGFAFYSVRSMKKSEALLKDDPSYLAERRIMFSLSQLCSYTFARSNFTADQQLMRYDRIEAFGSVSSRQNVQKFCKHFMNNSHPALTVVLSAHGGVANVVFDKA